MKVINTIQVYRVNNLQWLMNANNLNHTRNQNQNRNQKRDQNNNQIHVQNHYKLEVKDNSNMSSINIQIIKVIR